MENRNDIDMDIEMDVNEEKLYSISILLASYNGEKYIAEQIESLLAQTAQDFKLFICDDKSTDNTFLIASEYAQRYPNKISVYQNEENTGNAKYNFIRMMIEHKNDYVMLCDQDDVWLPDKIEKSLAKICELEAVYGITEPLLVHTDLRVVDKELSVMSPSYAQMSRTDYTKKSLNNLLTRNIASGCTQIYNRALADLIVSEPKYMLVHDWWVALIAATFGKIIAIHEPTILYRQHGNNSIGAKKEHSWYNIYYRLTNFDKTRKLVSDTYRQAGSLLNLYHNHLSNEHKDLLSAYSSIPRCSKIKRLRILFKYKVFMYGVIRKLGQIFIILTEGREHS